MSTEYFGCRGHKTNDKLALLNTLTNQQKRQIHDNRAVGLMLSQKLNQVKVWRGKRMRGHIPRSDSGEWEHVGRGLRRGEETGRQQHQMPPSPSRVGLRARMTKGDEARGAGMKRIQMEPTSKFLLCLVDDGAPLTEFRKVKDSIQLLF